MYYIFYNLTTGQITQKGFSIAEPTPPSGFAIIEIDDNVYNFVDFSKYYADVQTKQIIEKLPKPDGFYNFDYDTKTWVLDTQTTIDFNRAKRNTLLQESDWTQLPDVDLTQEQKNAWAVYRQKLRNMTENDFLTGNFPTKPTN